MSLSKREDALVYGRVSKCGLTQLLGWTRIFLIIRIKRGRKGENLNRHRLRIQISSNRNHLVLPLLVQQRTRAETVLVDPRLKVQVPILVLGQPVVVVLSPRKVLLSDTPRLAQQQAQI